MLLFAVGLLLQTQAAQGTQQPSSQGGAQAPVHATISVSPDTVTIGQHFTATIRIRAPRGATFDIPARLDTLNRQGVDTAAAFERFDADTADAYSDVTAVYTLAAWDLGLQPLGLDSIVVHTQGGDTTLVLNRANVFVRSTLPKDTKLQVPKPPLSLLPEPAEVRRRHRQWALAAAAILLAALIGGFAWWWYRRTHQPGLPPEIVESEFKRVESMHLLEKGEAEQHAILMSSVLRDYLVRHFPAVRASATTRELVDALKSESMIPSDRTLELFEHIDLLKFARSRTAVEDGQAAGVESREIVSEVIARELAALEERLRQEQARADELQAEQLRVAQAALDKSGKPRKPRKPGNVA